MATTSSNVKAVILEYFAAYGQQRLRVSLPEEATTLRHWLFERLCVKHELPMYICIVMTQKLNFLASSNKLEIDVQIGVACDGSDVSKKAFEVGCRFLNTSRKDRLFTLHVLPSRSKVSEPLQKAEHVQHEFERLAFQHKVESTFYSREKKAGEETCPALVRLAQELDLDLMCIGSYGRKGEKAADVLGHVADGALRETSCSICVIKSSSFTLLKNMTYVFATDNGRASQLAFCFLIGLANPGDTVHVVMSHTDAKQQAVLQAYKDILVERKLNGDVHFLFDSVSAGGVADKLMAESERLEADMLVMGVANYKTKKLGSVSEEVVRHSRVSVLLVKDPMEAKERRLITGGVA